MLSRRLKNQVRSQLNKLSCNIRIFVDGWLAAAYILLSPSTKEIEVKYLHMDTYRAGHLGASDTAAWPSACSYANETERC